MADPETVVIHKIRILFLIGSYGTGGKERQLAEVIKTLSPEHFEIHLLVKSEGTYYLDGLQNKLTSFCTLNRQRFGFKSFFLISRYIKQVEPEIIHSWEAAATVFALLIRFLTFNSTKIIDGSIRQAPAGFKPYSKSWFERKFISVFSDLVIGNSNAGLKSYSSSPGKSICIYNGFDLQRLATLQPVINIRSKLKINTEFIIGMVARFEPQKDWNTFLVTAKRLVKERKDLTILAIGDGPMFDVFKSDIPGEFSERIIFTGLINNVESYVNTFDIGILTTNNAIHGEGISNSILEYMALSKPVIATGGGGTPELIEDSGTGFIIPDHEPNELYTKINHLLDHPEIREKMGQAGRLKVERDFSIERMNEEFVKAYNRLI